MAVSLFTFRFADRAAAMQQFDRIDQAVTACAGRQIKISAAAADRAADAGSPFTRRGTLVRTAPVPLADITQQTGYLFTTDTGLKFAVQVFVYDNLVSWQFRYDPLPGAYDPSQADQLTDSLAQPDPLHRRGPLLTLQAPSVAVANGYELSVTHRPISPRK